MRQARGGVLVVGGGFAGGYVARLLGERGATIVSPENFMLYTPMLPEAASGTLEPRHTVVPLRQMCPHAELVLGRVTAIDEEQQSVARRDAGRRHVRHRLRPARARARRRATHLPGARPRRARPRLQGSRRRDQPPQPRPARARGRRRGARRRATPPRHLGFVFVGAGYAGVEALAELSDLANDALRWYPRLRERAAALGARRRRAEDPGRDPAPPRRLRGEGAHAAAASRSTSRRRWRRSTARTAVLSNGDADPGADARLDGRRQGEPAARRVRDAAGRARPCPGRLVPPRRGPRARLVARRLRRRPERAHAGPVRPADLPARAPPGAAAGEEPRSATASRTATGCSARWRRSGATRESPT